MRQVCVFEGSDDGKEWHEYRYEQTSGFSFVSPLQYFLGYDLFYNGTLRFIVKSQGVFN